LKKDIVIFGYFEKKKNRECNNTEKDRREQTSVYIVLSCNVLVSLA